MNTSPSTGDPPANLVSSVAASETEGKAQDEELLYEIDPEDLAFLIGLGIPQEKCESALSQTGNRSDALEYLSEQAKNTSASDALECLSEQEKTSGPKLSPEEAQRRALELQKMVRERRIAREKEESRLSEKRRLEEAKIHLDSVRQLEEAERRRQTEQLLRDREEKKIAEERQKQLLAQEYRERFGREMEPATKDVSQLSPRDQCLYHLRNLKTELHSPDSSPEYKEKLLICLKTLKIYCLNAKNNPTNPKYQVIRLSNKVFVEKVSIFENAVSLLESAGFIRQSDETLKIVGGIADGFVLGECVKFLDFLTRAE